jgi:hypothetical protein
MFRLLGIFVFWLVSSMKASAECLEGNCVKGLGAYLFPDGAAYVGEYKNGKAHGYGSYKFPDGTEWLGEFKDDGMSGRGTYNYADGTTETGLIENGEFIWDSDIEKREIYLEICNMGIKKLRSHGFNFENFTSSKHVISVNDTFFCGFPPNSKNMIQVSSNPKRIFVANAYSTGEGYCVILNSGQVFKTISSEC